MWCNLSVFRQLRETGESIMIGKVQAQYFSQLLQIIRDNPGTSRVQLAQSMGLDRSSITNLINALLDHGLLRHSDGSQVGEKSGRRQIPLELHADYGVLAGIQVQQDSCVAVLTNLTGRVLYIKKEVVDISGDNVSEILLKAIELCKTEAGSLDTSLLGLGVGITGIVDYHRGMIVQSKPLYVFEPLEILPVLQAGNNFPVYIDNDTNCCSWGVLAFSAERNIRDFLYVLLELEDDPRLATSYKRMSTGWAFALNGTVYYGDSGSAGEFKSFLARTHSEDQFSIDYRTRLTMKSNAAVRGAFMEELARNIAFTANILNLSHIFLGGNLDTMSSELSGIIQREVNINWLYNGKVDLDLRFSGTEAYPVAVGAAGLAAERLFEIPFMRVSAIVEEIFSFHL